MGNIIKFPSKRIVSPGAGSLCARVAAKRGMPTPAKTTCPSFNARALIIQSSSEEVKELELIVINTSPSLRCIENFIYSD